MSRGPWHVAVLMGGWSAERDVSLMSGKGIADALESRGHKVTRIDMDRDVALRLSEAKPDVVFNALHGVPGEDGTVQGMLDLMGLKYTHSGLVTSVIAIDKELTKQALVPHGVPMPTGVMVDSESLFTVDPLPRPYVLKPVNEGSSVGVAIVKDDSNYGNPIAREAIGPWQEFDRLLAEPFIKGRELTVAVLGDAGLGADGVVVQLAGLGFVEAEVGTLLFHQGIVVADLDDLPPVQHHQPVGLAQGGKTVGDGDGGTAADEVLEGGLDFHLGLGIHCRGGLVEDQDARVDEQRAGDGDALALAPRQGLTALADE